MKCMNNCGVELTGRQRTYCSDKCRKQAERQNNTSPRPAQSSNSDKVILSNPDKSKSDTVTRTASLQDYYDHPDDYCRLREPERMNWGAWMNTDKLRQAGFRANRLSIPGDWDYMHGSVEVEK